jgi:hypothetical protein
MELSDANRGINASGLQYMAPENVYWEYSAGMETSSKCFVSILPGGNYLNRYAAILSKRIFGFFLGTSSCTLYLLCQTLA